MSQDQAREILACARVLAHWYPHEEGLSRLIHIFTAGPDEPWIPPSRMSASENSTPQPAPDLRRAMSKVHIEVSANGHDGKVVIDDHDIAKSVTGFTVRAELGHPTRVELDLRAHDVTTFAAPHAQVLIDTTAAEYLERAGWTPPPGVRSVLSRDSDGCPCEQVEIADPDGGPMDTKRILGRTVPTCPVHGVNTGGQ